MSEQKSSPIRSDNGENSEAILESSYKNENSGGKKNSSKSNGESSSNNVVFKRERPSRACTQRAAERLQAAARAEAEMEAEKKRKRVTRKQKLAARLLKEDSDFDDEDEGFDDLRDEDNVDEDDGEAQASSTSITPLVGDLEDSQLPRWNIRSMWQLASILNFLNVFRPLLNIHVEFSAEELETALLMPNNTLADIHIPLLKAIPPIIRMAHGHSTWITVLCRKLRDWWHWVAEGDLPIVASHGAEIETYNSLDPMIRVTILKALCDIRVEQEDIKIFIDDSIKNGTQLSLFRKQRIGGDSRGVSYWYEEDPIIGHRLYREIRKVEAKRGKGKSVPQIPHSSYHWEAVATNLDEFMNVSEKLFASKNRTEVSVGKKLKNDMIPEIEKVHKKKERLLKKQHREALMLNSIMHIDGLGGGRSLRDRKPVTYTFDDYDRSINEALKLTKNRQQSPEPHERGDSYVVRTDNSFNGGWAGTLRSTRLNNFSTPSPMSEDGDEMLEDQENEVFDDQRDESLDRGNRRRQRPQRYAENEFADGISDNEADPESDDDIVGEVVYDEEYLRERKRRRRKAPSSEEGDEEYKWDEEENGEEEEDEEEDNNSLSTSEEESDEHPRKSRNFRGRNTRRATRLRSVKEKRQTGLRRSKRSTRNRVNYKVYEMSESENELVKRKPENSRAEQSYDGSGNEEEDDDDGDPYSFAAMQDFDEGKIDEEAKPIEEKKTIETFDGNNEEIENKDRPDSDGDDNQEDIGSGKRRFLDLNELAPGNGFDDGPARDDGPSDF